jgi:NAD+ kinase
VADLGVPILGINLGKVGFLSKAEHQDLEAVLELLRSGEYELEPRLMLEVRVLAAGRGPAEDVHIALNEAAVVRGAHARVMHVVVDVGDSRVATWVCDGVVVASPTGSTGYSFSAGGPILEPTSRNLVVTPIAAYLTALRSSVVGPQHVVSVRITWAHDALLSIDGRDEIPLAVGDRVEVRARQKPIDFIQPRGALPFWDLLRQKAELLPA